jgi:hypothetical protein
MENWPKIKVFSPKKNIKTLTNMGPPRFSLSLSFWNLVSSETGPLSALRKEGRKVCSSPQRKLAFPFWVLHEIFFLFKKEYDFELGISSIFRPRAVFIPVKQDLFSFAWRLFFCKEKLPVKEAS